MDHLDLCSGGGGFHLAAQLAGLDIYKTFFADINEYANKIYKARFPSAVALGDLRNIHRNDFADDGKWLVTAGFPCQPFSVAGSGKGIDDDRYLWDEILRIVVEFRADWFVFENVAGIETVPFSKSEARLEMRRNQRTERFDDFEAIYARQEELQLAKCCQDLEDACASFQVFDIPAVSVNAWHRRRRIWIVGSFADSNDGHVRPPEEIRTGRKSLVIGHRRNNSDAHSESKCSRHREISASDEKIQERDENSQSYHSDIFSHSDDHNERKFQSQRITGNERRRTRNGHSGNIADVDSIGLNTGRCEKPTGRKKSVSDNSDNQSERSKESCFEKQVRFGKTDRSDAHHQWRRHWVEIAAELCRGDDGLRNELDAARLRHDLKRLYPAITEADIERAIDKLESEYRRKRIELMGNSIVPQVAAEFFKVIKKLEK